MSGEKKVPLEQDSDFHRLNKPNYNFDIAKAFKLANPNVCDNYEKSRYVITPEHSEYWSWYYNTFESKFAHGYPYTFLLQGGIIYACALYTAREQGITKNFIKSHWFDWITFFKRAGVFGVAGGLVLGTIFFGDPQISLRRISNWYQRRKTPPAHTPNQNYHYKEQKN
jgi:hypothetical protein